MKWEYMTISHSVEDEELNKNGRDGWELVAVTEILTSGSYFVHRYYFKRPLTARFQSLGVD